MIALYGWVGRVLRVDLTNQEVRLENSWKYVEKFIGGRGLADIIAWREIKPGMSEFSEENLLIFATGPLTGTISPTSGRTCVASIAPQVYPNPWFTRSNMGGWWGAELKYAGYDALVIRGVAEKPTYILVNDDHVDLLSAEDLWGLDTYSTQSILWKKHGRDAKAVTIGKAGEKLSRISVIQTDTENAAGQGGFGAVMGYKRLKAIVVKGSGRVAVAEPKRLIKLVLAMRKQMGSVAFTPIKPTLNPEHVKLYGLKLLNCTHACFFKCPECFHYKDVPGVINPGLYSGQTHCVSPMIKGVPGTFYDWKVGFRAGFELTALLNMYGINHWEIVIGLFPWLKVISEKGVLKEIDGLKIDVNDPRFWYEIIRGIGEREGVGKLFSDGGIRAAIKLVKGLEEAFGFWPAYGFSGHYDRRGDRINPSYYPIWVVAALQWATDTRDPFDSGHGYCASFSHWSRHIDFQNVLKVAEKVYGSSKAIDPKTPLEYKAYVAVWHQNRSALKDSIPVCDWCFPRFFSEATKDNYAILKVDGEVISGPSIEYHLFKSVTGLDWSEEEFNKAGERIFNLERAIQVRNYARSREVDEKIIPYYEKPEIPINSKVKPMRISREEFRKLLNEYYRIRGWEVKTGRPKKEKLIELGLKEVALELEKLKLI